MNVTSINQQTGHNNTAFGWSKVEPAADFDTAVKKLSPEIQTSIKNMVKSIDDEKYSNDNRVLRIISGAIQLFDEKLGNISYKIDLQKPESIKDSANQAFNDRVNIMNLPEYAKKLSEIFKIKLDFSPNGIFHIANENPSSNAVTHIYENCAIALKAIANKASGFKDKSNIKISLARGNNSNSLALSMQKGEITSQNDLFIHGTNQELLEKNVEERIEKLHKNIHDFLGN